jgi:3-hydroxyisobutyrate dehydrogenase
VAVADAVGVDRAVAWDAIAPTALGGAINRATATGASFAIALAAKDLDLALAELGGADAPVARAVAPALHAAPDQSADIATIIASDHS